MRSPASSRSPSPDVVETWEGRQETPLTTEWLGDAGTKWDQVPCAKYPPSHMGKHDFPSPRQVSQHQAHINHKQTAYPERSRARPKCTPLHAPRLTPFAAKCFESERHLVDFPSRRAPHGEMPGGLVFTPTTRAREGRVLRRAASPSLPGSLAPRRYPPRSPLTASPPPPTSAAQLSSFPRVGNRSAKARTINVSVLHHSILDSIRSD